LHPTIRGIPPLPFVENDKTVEHDPDQSQFTARFTKLAVGFIKEHAGKKPFFLYLPHVMPHVPIFASPAFRGTSKRGLYGDVVQELDAGVGDVLKALADTGVEKNTLVVFLSDNGPFLSYGDHAGRADPFREGKLTTYEGGVRVPFILRWPGHVPQGKTETRFSTGLDVLPTLVALAGLKSPRNRIDGEDLSELWLGREGAPVRNRFAYYAGTELQAVRRGQFKLHLPHSYLAVDGEPGRGGKPANVANMKPKQIEESGIQGIASRHGYKVLEQSLALYDLDTDPGERTDVKDRYPKVVTELKAWAQIVAQDLGDTLTKTPGRGQRPVGTVEK
jgi:arylsulfatase A-like enzyme